MEAEITAKAVELGTNTDFSLFSLFFRADIVVKSVMIILILCSVYSWAVIIEKFRLFKKIVFTYQIAYGINTMSKHNLPKFQKTKQEHM